jgi:nitroreductase
MRRPEVVDFLRTRRSRPPKFLQAPGPDRDVLLGLLTSAVRAPDHGKLEPWRFVVLEGAGKARLAAAIRARAAETGADADKGALAYEQAPVSVAVVASPKAADRIPAIEQTLSAGAVALGLVNAALADGWGASWLTGWPVYDRPFIAGALGLAADEWVAGFVHLGSCEVAVPVRPRPDVPAMVTWLDR